MDFLRYHHILQETISAQSLIRSILFHYVWDIRNNPHKVPWHTLAPYHHWTLEKFMQILHTFLIIHTLVNEGYFPNKLAMQRRLSFPGYKGIWIIWQFENFAYFLKPPNNYCDIFLNIGQWVCHIGILTDRSVAIIGAYVSCLWHFEQQEICRIISHD